MVEGPSQQKCSWLSGAGCPGGQGMRWGGGWCLLWKTESVVEEEDQLHVNLSLPRFREW